LTLRFLLVVLLTLFASAGWAAPPIQLTVDARDVVRPGQQKVHVRLDIPTKSGALALEYPRWIPGMHGPVGPLKNIADLKIVAGGRPLMWRRDSTDLAVFHTDIPPGVASVEVTFDYLPVRGDTSEVSYGVAASPNVAILNGNAFLLYPRGANIRTTRMAYRLLLPESWKTATALTVEQETADGTVFAPVSLETLADSPVFAGAYARKVTLTGDPKVPHYLYVFGENENDLRATVTPRLIGNMNQLVAETGALFGVRHYRHFSFLLAVSDKIPVFGLEHHESSVNVLPWRSFSPEGMLPGYWDANLLPHEYVHSWNGKHRRPTGLVSDTFNSPLSTDLLWVYEGLTEYLGEVLMVRSGFRSPDRWRGDLLGSALGQSDRMDRAWQPLADVATAYPLLEVSGFSPALRGTNDVYYESMHHWLEADALIRRESGGARSLDDFCRRFFGGTNGPPTVKPYTMREVIETLNAVQPHDWAEFWEKRLQARDTTLPQQGIEASGWRMVFTDNPPPDRQGEAQTNFRHSLGFSAFGAGNIARVMPDMPAAKAGIVNGMQIIGVNGQRYTPALLRDAVRATRNNIPSIELLVWQEDRYRTIRIDYQGGERLPVLERIPDVPDLLKAIATPRIPMAFGPPMPPIPLM
jgi:predicted metalloprotease with PDZ domain